MLHIEYFRYEFLAKVVINRIYTKNKYFLSTLKLIILKETGVK